MSLNKRCYYCYNEAIQIRHDIPRCLDHCPSFVKDNKAKIEDKGPETPKLPTLFGMQSDGWLDNNF